MNVKEKLEKLYDEYRLLAREENALAGRVVISDDNNGSRKGFAYAYSVMADQKLRTLLSAEREKPERFSGKNKGTQKKTLNRGEYLRELSRKCGTKKYEALAVFAIENPNYKETKKHWKDKRKAKIQSAVLGFLKRHKPLS